MCRVFAEQIGQRRIQPAAMLAAATVSLSSRWRRCRWRRWRPAILSQLQASLPCGRCSGPAYLRSAAAAPGLALVNVAGALSFFSQATGYGPIPVQALVLATPDRHPAGRR
ncbi:MAG: hypothetical protein U1E93_10915 [Alphaproteobacteria bacterium]